MRRCVAGEISEAFSTTVLPTASGTAMARTPRITGAFHGAMPTTTPAGWRRPSASVPRVIGRNGLAADLRGQRGGFFQQRGGEAGVEVAPAGDGAGFRDAQARELGALGAQLRGGFHQQLAARVRAQRGPGGEGLGGGIDGGARIVGRGGGGAHYHFTGDRAPAFEGLAALGIDVGTTDQQFDFVHGRNEPRVVVWMSGWKGRKLST